MTRALFRLVPVLASLALVACGGGGGGRDGGFEPPQNDTIRLTPSSTTLGVSSLTDVTVAITRHGGGAVADGTSVQLSVTPANLGQVGAASGENQSFNNSATATTSGGQARFRFKSTQATGTATLTASAPSSTGGSSITATTNISLNGGPSNDTRLTLTADRTTIPVNSAGVPPSCRNYPYQAEVTVTWRNLRGELVTVPEDEEAMRAAWTSSESVGAITTPDNPETDENECEMFMASMGVPVNAGRGTVFVRSLSQAGTGTLSVSVRDLDTGEDLNATMNFTMSSGAPSLPAAVIVSPSNAPTYVSSSGGNTSNQLSVSVNDGAGTPVPNPDGVNNVRLELLNPQGERLSTTNAAGQTQEGTAVNTRTFNGIAGAIFLASDRQGTITVRATADRADNNVDNGIQDPVVGEAAIVVSDGRLFSVTLSMPILESLYVNRQNIIVPGDDNDDFVPPPDGTYSIIVGAIATDRLGNPVLPGTVLSFGMIDSPLAGFPAQGSGTFAISGGNGNPQEGQRMFTAPSGAFTTAGGGAGPGDALVLFGRDVQGNRDLESARVIQSIQNAGQLTVERRFNRNDDTGQLVDYGPVIPYAIGRATIGNIGASATTNQMGVANTTLNYPVSQLGRAAIVWVQGEGAIVSGEAKTVADVERAVFAGVGPLEITANPTSITANGSTSVLVCLTDARIQPLPGVDISFAFEGLTSGTGAVSGRTGSGVAGRTLQSGCLTAVVVTSGIQAGDGERGVRFFYGGSSILIPIVGGTEPEPDPETFNLVVVVVGNGTVNIAAAPSGFSPPTGGSGNFTCPTDCQHSLVEGTNVNLSATPSANFINWTGACSVFGTNAGGGNLRITGDTTCTATFNP